MTRRIKQLHQAVPAAYVEVNRADADAIGIKKGDRVKVVSRRGSLELVVEIDGRGRPPRGTVFVPFFDLTNGAETYPGGRYLDLDRTASGVYDLDFNRAYHPFCLFNAEYDCPVPPRENRLAIPIRAGEKLETPK